MSWQISAPINRLERMGGCPPPPPHVFPPCRVVKCVANRDEPENVKKSMLALEARLKVAEERVGELVTLEARLKVAEERVGELEIALVSMPHAPIAIVGAGDEEEGGSAMVGAGDEEEGGIGNLGMDTESIGQDFKRKYAKDPKTDSQWVKKGLLRLTKWKKSVVIYKKVLKKGWERMDMRSKNIAMTEEERAEEAKYWRRHRREHKRITTNITKYKWFLQRALNACGARIVEKLALDNKMIENINCNKYSPPNEMGGGDDV